MTIQEDGNVGINDTTPTYKLDVNGTFRTTGAATFDTTATIAGNTNVRGERLQTGDGTRVYQVLNGSHPSVAHNTWTTIAYAGYTHVLQVMVWATTGGQRNRFSIFDVITSYGSNQVNTERETGAYAPDTPSVDNIEFQYNNNGYKIDVRITVSDSSTASAVSWAITGMAYIDIYNA